VALVQRSCGYTLRPTLSVDDVERAVAAVRAQSATCAVLVDNCYGEFTELREPPMVCVEASFDRVQHEGSAQPASVQGAV